MSRGSYKPLFVAPGDEARGKTHCLSCGGRTRDRNAQNKAQHSSCAGGKKRRANKPA